MSTNQNNLPSRIREVATKLNLKLNAFSDELQVPYRTLQNYLDGSRTPKIDFVVKMHQVFGVSMEWLLMGKGDMFFVSVNLSNQRCKRICSYIEYYMSSHNEDEQAWFEVNFKKTNPSYDEFISNV